ncbi:MAG TPA: nucleotide exchange factor GrpE [Thermodesulfobacteriota bacterium]|nr:nucleotide exchange factor GrpE [Thermodesulfobacteriota bacterium]
MNSEDKKDKTGQIEISEEDETNEGAEDVRAEVGDDKNYKELYQRYIRLAADFENYKKRLAKEKADIITYGNEELIKALLNVLDNLERALSHGEGPEKDTKAVLEGVRLVHKQFLSLLEKFGVEPVPAERGLEFDPRVHQAIERVDSADVESGRIISEMLRGYTLKDRLLRPALVSVSKGGGEPRDNGSPADKNNGGDGGNSSGIFDLTDEG